MSDFLAVAVPIVMALAAAGAVLSIKIVRRRQATRSGRLGGVVPANPMSPAQARQLSRRYLLTAALILGVLVVLALAVFGGSLH